MKEFTIVHLKKHTGDFTGEVGLSLVDEGIQALSKHLLLLGGTSSGKRLGTETGSGLSGLLGEALGLGSDRHLTSGDGASGKTKWGTNWRWSAVGSWDSSGWSSTLGAVGSNRVVGAWHTWVAHLWGWHTVWHGHAWLTTWGTGVSGSSLLHHWLLTWVASHDGATSHAWHGHAWLTGVSWHWGVSVDGGTHVAWSGHAATVSESLGLSLLHLRLEGLSTDVFSLSEGDVEGLGADHLAVHLLDSFGGLVGGRVAHETKVLIESARCLMRDIGHCTHPGGSALVLHDSAAGDGTKGVELGSESLVVPLVCAMSAVF